MTLQYSDSPQYKPTVVTLFLQTSQSAGLYFCLYHVSELDDCLLQQQHQWRHGSHQVCHRPRRLQSREEPAAVTAATGSRLLMVMTDQSSTHGESAVLCVSVLLTYSASSAQLAYNLAVNLKKLTEFLK